MAVEVNLLPGNDLEGKAGGKFLAWALTWGKKIVIITEAIVILVFLSRFWLDTTIADQGEKINQKRSIIEASANFETQFREVATRINNIQVVTADASILEGLDRTLALIPPLANVTNISVDKNRISFNGSADSSTLAVMVANFKDAPDFADLNVSQLTKTGQAPVIDFSLAINYVGKQIK